MKPWTPYLLAAATLSGCVAYTAKSTPDGMIAARIGQTVYVDGPRVTPLAVLEDRRCQIGADCLFAPMVRISAQVHTGRGTQTRELALGQPIPVADGTLELVGVTPTSSSNTAISPKDYRFTFRFMGGI